MKFFGLIFLFIAALLTANVEAEPEPQFVVLGGLHRVSFPSEDWGGRSAVASDLEDHFLVKTWTKLELFIQPASFQSFNDSKILLQKYVFRDQ